MAKTAEHTSNVRRTLVLTVSISIGAAVLASLMIHLLIPTAAATDSKIGIVDSRRLITSFEGTQDALAMLEVGQNQENSVDSTSKSITPPISTSGEVGLNDPSVVGPLFATINQLVEQYSIEKGYDLILGTTDDGSILYGAEAVDITDDLLAYINRSYRAE